MITDNRTTIAHIMETVQSIEWRSTAATVDQHAFDLMVDSDELAQASKILDGLLERIEQEVGYP